MTATGERTSSDDSGVLDEVYERLHRTGPEYAGRLSNHGPMAAEALVRMGHGERVHRWVDRYLPRLDELPRPSDPIEPGRWPDALGDAKRVGDWLTLFAGELATAPWREVLATWWPRLLPGIAAGATHGVIRTGHAARALLEAETAPRIAELGQSLGYWAARWQRIPSVSAPIGPLDPAAALAGLPGIAVQVGAMGDRLPRLPDTPGWTAALQALSPPASPDEVPALLGRLCDAAVTRYAANAHGNPIMLIHAATAPSAVLLTLPALPREQWPASLDAAWAASAAVTSAYTPPEPLPVDTAPTTTTAEDAADLAARHGDEHVIKFTEAALRAHSRGAGPVTLRSIARAAELIGPAR